MLFWSICCAGLLFAIASAERVPPPRTPTNVYVAVLFNYLDKIDGEESTFQLDMWLSLFWYDPRTNVSTGDPSRADLFWTPAIDFVNIREAAQEFVHSDLTYSDLPDPTKRVTMPQGEDANHMNEPWIQYTQRYVGSFTAKLDLRQFPFDRQTASIRLESGVYTDKDVLFYPGKSEEQFRSFLLPDDLVVPEFDIVDTSVTMPKTYYAVYDETYSTFVVAVEVARQPTYYLLKIVAGCILLVLMSIATFVLDVTEPDRLMGTLTVFLALVSFVFIAEQNLPKVAYLTKIDQFLFLSFISVAAMAVAHIVGYFIHFQVEAAKEESETAERKEPLNTVELQNIEDIGLAREVALPYVIGEDFDNVPPKAPTPRQSRCCSALARLRTSLRSAGAARRLDIACLVVFLISYIIGTCAILRNSN